MKAARYLGDHVVVEPYIVADDVDTSEADLRGTIAYVNNHPATIKLVQQGKVDLKPFITAKIGLDELVSKGFDTLINHNDTAVKVLVDPRL